MDERHQQLHQEWDEEKNAPLRFEDMTKGSSRKVWWKCALGHDWKARFSNRVHGNDCPYCAGILPIPGETDLETCFPAIAAQWHSEKNGTKRPCDFLPYSNKRVWWRCELGHEWEAKINNRTTGGTNCPYCNGDRVIQGENDLETCFPNLAQEWHPSKNGELHPSEVLPKSNRYVWWHCSRKHEWKAKIYHRVEGTGCPYCVGMLPIPGETDLATLYPWLVPQWHPTKNKVQKPTDYTGQSHQKVWWICDKGHEWKATITSRANGRACPICSGRTVLIGFNDLTSRMPELAGEWDYGKNGTLTPEKVTPYSNKSVWWIGGCGHGWQAKINNRTNGTGCPFCKQNRLIPEKTSLAVRNPKLAQQWDMGRNAPVTPKDVTEFCNREYWWICDKGHRWKATVSNRSYEEDCPYCAHRLAIPGETDLETENPSVAAEWHPIKNHGRRPSEFLPMSSYRAWWQCKKGHEWQAMICSRSYGAGCPICQRRRQPNRRLVP